jgi:hypothetical protein
VRGEAEAPAELASAGHDGERDRHEPGEHDLDRVVPHPYRDAAGEVPGTVDEGRHRLEHRHTSPPRRAQATAPAERSRAVTRGLIERMC